METIDELRQEAHDANKKFKEFFYTTIVMLSFTLAYVFFGIIDVNDAFFFKIILLIYTPAFVYLILGTIYCWSKKQAKLEEIQKLSS